jgi:hypothetical protein
VKYPCLIVLLATLSATAQPWPSDDSSKFGLVGWWTFNEGTGTVANDYSGMGKSGYLTNSPLWSPGAIGSGLNFKAGSNSIAIFPAMTNPPNPVSICWWQNPIAAYNSATIRAIWGQKVLPTGPELSCQVYSDNNWYVGWNTSLDKRVALAASAANWITNAWHLYAFISTTNNSVLYMDGIGIATNASAPVTASISAPFMVGTYAINENGRSGLIDDVRIYNRALSAAEVAGLYWETASQWKQGP